MPQVDTTIQSQHPDMLFEMVPPDGHRKEGRANRDRAIPVRVRREDGEVKGAHPQGSDAGSTPGVGRARRGPFLGSDLRSQLGRRGSQRNRRLEREGCPLPEAEGLKLFIDSGAFIAPAITNDRYHERAANTFGMISRRELPYRFQYTFFRRGRSRYLH